MEWVCGCGQASEARTLPADAAASVEGAQGVRSYDGDGVAQLLATGGCANAGTEIRGAEPPTTSIYRMNSARLSAGPTSSPANYERPRTIWLQLGPASVS